MTNFTIILGAGAATPPVNEATLDLAQVFRSCPIIYTLLITLSIVATVIWVYSLFTIRTNDMMPDQFMQQIRELFGEKRYEEAIAECRKEGGFSATVIASAIAVRSHGPQVMMDALHAEGRRCASNIWQRLSFLNEIAVIAPMLGLLGTVLGLFFAFYNTSQTADNITSIFDGLGIAVGTTVAGLIVAILAMIYYTTLKFRVVAVLNTIENESATLVSTIDMERRS